MNRHRRIHLSIIIAAAVLALNAFAVTRGWSPFQMPESQPGQRSGSLSVEAGAAPQTGRLETRDIRPRA